MKKHFFLIEIIACGTISGCASGPLFTEDQLTQMNCGPAPQHYTEAITNYFYPTLKDPDSAEYKFETPYKQALAAGVFDLQKFYLGWEVDVQMNAKNSYGGYVGYTSYRFLFQNEKIAAEADSTANYYWLNMPGIVATEVTNKAAY